MVIFLPTSGYNRQNPWQPTLIGLKRIEKAVRTLRANPNDLVIIAGGCAINLELSEAKVYHRYIEENFPDITHQVLGISDSGICTVQDLREAVTKVPSGQGPEIGFIGPRCQARRAALTLKALGFHSVIHLPSHEKEPGFLSRRWWRELKLYWVTQCDPLWQGERAQKIIACSKSRLDREIRPMVEMVLASNFSDLPLDFS